MIEIKQESQLLNTLEVQLMNTKKTKIEFWKKCAGSAGRDNTFL